jgi:hypothetical protein
MTLLLLLFIIMYLFIHLLTSIWLTPGGSSRVHLHANSTHNNTRQNTQNGTYITIRIQANKRTHYIKKYITIRIHIK